MTLVNLIVLAFGLSMDATAVAMARGMCTSRKNLFKTASIYSISFGLFQGIMPLLGYLLASQFTSFIESLDHWIAFLLLGVLGLSMILEKHEAQDNCKPLTLKNVLLLSVATSIDALAIGITLAFLSVNILKAALIIGVLTTIISFLGAYIGFQVGSKLERFAGILGGVILIIIGTKTLIEHLFFH